MYLPPKLTTVLAFDFSSYIHHFTYILTWDFLLNDMKKLTNNQAQYIQIKTSNKQGFLNDKRHMNPNKYHD